MRVLIGLLALNGCFLVWGYAILAVVRRSISVADLGLAFCVGFGGLCSFASLVAVAGHVPGVTAVGVLSGLLLSALVATAVVRRRRFPSRRSRRSSLAGVEAVAVGLLALAALAYSFALVREATVLPLREWDAWADWTLKAKALVLMPNLDVADFIGPHGNYPILVPMMQALVFRFIGSFDSQVLHVEYALLVVAFAGAVWRLLSERAPAVVAAAAGFVVLLLPGLELNVPDALADVPVAIFVALAALSMAAWLSDSRGQSLVLFALFGAFACWTKNEGSMLVAVVGVLGIAASVTRRPRTTLLPALAVAAAIGSTYPWRSWLRVRDVHVDTPLFTGVHMSYLRAHVSDAVPISQDFWDHVGDVHAWFAAPYVLAALSIVVFATGRRRLALFSVGVPTAVFLCFLWVYLIRNDALGLTWFIATSTSRTMMSIGLLTAVLALFQISTLLEPRGDTDADSRSTSSLDPIPR